MKQYRATRFAVEARSDDQRGALVKLFDQRVDQVLADKGLVTVEKHDPIALWMDRPKTGDQRRNRKKPLVLSPNSFAFPLQVKAAENVELLIFLSLAQPCRLKGQSLLANVRTMPRTFSIEVAKDYFNFASAHFLIFANGRREPLHGHNYQVSVAMEGELDRAGVVLDFITFKPLVKQVCDALDHRTLIQTSSSAIQVRKNAQDVEILYKKQRLVLPRGDVILLPIAN